MTDYGFVRVSTGSQDAQSQRRDILTASPCAVIITPDTKAASASKGQQLDALDAVIARLCDGDRIIVTDSSRLDRRDNLTSQVETMLTIRKTGAVIVSLAVGEETFANGDDLGSWVTTLVKQNANAEKSRTVKIQTLRGLKTSRDNHAHVGPLPTFWAAQGVRYAKQAYCVNPAAVTDIYERIADGESIASVALRHDLYPQTLKTLVRFAANHTGVIDYSYTFDGLDTIAWSHKVEPVIDSALWWRANKTMTARAAKQGRPIAWANTWISGVLDCPECGGHLYLNAGNTPQGHPRTPMLRCGGFGKKRLSCGKFKGCDVRPVIASIEAMFSKDDTEILAFQRVAGNAHELDELRASLARIQARLSATEDDDELDALVAARKAAKAAVEAFTVISDSFDYAPTGQTVSGMWSEGDDTTRRSMLRAVKTVMGLDLNPDVSDVDRIYVGILPAEVDTDGIVDLGGGICFRREAA